jgi:hypothetical protein
MAAASLALLVVQVAGDAAAGAEGYDQVLSVAALCGGRFADHDPGHWDTEGISAEVAADLDPRPYLMPDFEDVAFRSRDARAHAPPRLVDPAPSPTRAGGHSVHGQSRSSRRCFSAGRDAASQRVLACSSTSATTAI